MEKYFILISIFLCLYGFFSSWIKSILSNNDYTVKPFSLRIGETRTLFKLVSLTNNRGRKWEYRIVGSFNILSLIGMIISLILFCGSIYKSIKDIPCIAYNEFKNYQYNNKVINKYIDSTEHSYRTLILKDDKGNGFMDRALISDRSGLFDFISVGDSINKKQGTTLVNVIHNKTDTTFVVDFGCGEN